MNKNTVDGKHHELTKKHLATQTSGNEVRLATTRDALSTTAINYVNKLEARSVRESPRTVIVAIYRRKCCQFLAVVDWFLSVVG